MAGKNTHAMLPVVLQNEYSKLCLSDLQDKLYNLAHEFVGQILFKIVALFIHQLDKTSSCDSKQELAL